MKTERAGAAPMRVLCARVRRGLAFAMKSRASVVTACAREGMLARAPLQPTDPAADCAGARAVR